MIFVNITWHVQGLTVIQCLINRTHVEDVVSLRSLNKNVQLKIFECHCRIESIDEIRVWVSDNPFVADITRTVLIKIFVHDPSGGIVSLLDVTKECAQWLTFPDNVYIIIDNGNVHAISQYIIAIVHTYN